jgi:hypothetical protein
VVVDAEDDTEGVPTMQGPSGPMVGTAAARQLHLGGDPARKNTDDGSIEIEPD